MAVKNSNPVGKRRTSRSAAPTGRQSSKPAVVRAANSMTVLQLTEAIRDGLPASELVALKEALGASNEQMARFIGTSTATLNRRRDGGRLTAVEGDRVVRFARLYGLALEVMGTPEHARAWLASAQRGLGGATPLEHALTELGAREVEELLGRIEHGVYP